MPCNLIRAFIILVLTGLVSACSDGSDSPPGFRLAGCADTASCAPNPDLTIGGERPAMVALPSNYDITRRYPLVMVLHGRGVNGLIQSIYMGLFDRVETHQYVLVYPDGLEINGRRQWRSTPTCCDTPPQEADAISDVGYLSRLIEEAAQTYSVDTSRIGLIGHSSGGFMGLPATGKPGDMRVIDMYRRVGDKLTENWIFIDLLHFWHQQGLDVLARARDVPRT